MQRLLHSLPLPLLLLHSYYSIADSDSASFSDSSDSTEDTTEDATEEDATDDTENTDDDTDDTYTARLGNGGIEMTYVNPDVAIGKKFWVAAHQWDG